MILYAVVMFLAAILFAAVAVLFGGIPAGVIRILRVQKKYNGGVFS